MSTGGFAQPEWSPCTHIQVYQGRITLKTRGVSNYFQNFDSFCPLFFHKNREILYFPQY